MGILPEDRQKGRAGRVLGLAASSTVASDVGGVFPGHNTGLCLPSRGGVVIGWRHVEDGTSRGAGLDSPRQPTVRSVNGGPLQPTEG